jgi:hypothetical protein
MFIVECIKMDYNIAEVKDKLKILNLKINDKNQSGSATTTDHMNYIRKNKHSMGMAHLWFSTAKFLLSCNAH